MADAGDQREIREGEFLEELLHSSDIELAMADAAETPEKRQQREVEEFARFAKENDQQAVFNELTRRLDAWKSISLNIGVIGASGVGKSTFINTLRRLKPTDQGGAATHVMQTVSCATPYEHPENPSIMLWDLPGVGTPEFPRDGYLNKIEFEKYDFFVIMSCSRFTADDLWFATEIRKRKKQFYFVRTKVDDDLRSHAEDYGQLHSDANTLESIRSSCTVKLSEYASEEPKVFLICKNPLLHDFPVLEEKFITDLNGLKREAALLTLRSASKRITEEKARQLHTRFCLFAVGSGFCNTMPQLLLSSAVSGILIRLSDLGVTKLLERELKLYLKVYGLDEEGLTYLSESTSVPRKDLVKEIETYFWADPTYDKVLRALNEWGTRTGAAEGSDLKDTLWSIISDVCRLVCPSLASGVSSGYSIYGFLCATAASMQQATENVINTAFSKVAAIS